MVNFKYYLNRQGVRGQRGEKGDKGFTPSITEKTNTKDEYVLHVQNETDETSFDTPNLKEGFVPEDLGGTVVRYNRTTGHQYYGDVDEASITQKGVVKLATDEEVANPTQAGLVITSEQAAEVYTTKTETAEVTDSVDTLRKNLTTTQGNVSQNTSDINSLKQKQATSEAAISKNQVDISTNTQDITRLKNSVNSQAEDITNIETNVETLQTTVNGQTTDIGILKTSMSGKQNKLKAGDNITLTDNTDGTTTITASSGGGSSVTVTGAAPINVSDTGEISLAIDGQTLQVQDGKLHANLDELGNEVNTLAGEVTGLSADVQQLGVSVTGAEADISDLKIASLQYQTDISNLETQKQDVLSASTGIDISSNSVSVKPATTTSLGGVKPDGTTITVTDDGTITAVTSGGDAPENMVTTDTAQTITGVKTFNPTTGRTIFYAGDSSNYMQIGKDTSSDFPKGCIIFGSSTAGIKGLKTNNSGDTFKISSAGHTLVQTTGNTYISSGVYASSKNGIALTPTSTTAGGVTIHGGNTANNSSLGPDGKIKIGCEGLGTYANIKGLLIETEDGSSSSIYNDKRIWFGRANYRSSIKSAINSSNGQYIEIATSPCDTSIGSGYLTMTRTSLTYQTSDGTVHDLLASGGSSGDGADTNLSNLSDTGREVIANQAAPSDTSVAIDVLASDTEYTMPADGLLWVSASNSSINGYVKIQKVDSSLIGRSPVTPATVSATLPVAKNQTIKISYGEVTNIKILLFKSNGSLPSSNGGGGNITIDEDGMGLTLKAGTYTSGTNDYQTEPLSYTLTEDTHFTSTDPTDNYIMLNNSEPLDPSGTTTLPTTANGGTVNKGLQGISGVTAMTGIPLKADTKLMTIEYTPKDNEGFYTTDTINVTDTISNTLRYAIGTSSSLTQSLTLGIKLEEQTSNGTVVQTIQTEQQQTYDSQIITYSSSGTGSISISGSWYKTFYLNSSIPSKSITKGNKLVWTITNKTYNSNSFNAFAMSMDTTINAIQATVNKIGLREGMEDGKYMISTDYENIWDLGYITMSDTTENKMVSYSETNPEET